MELSYIRNVTSALKFVDGVWGKTSEYISYLEGKKMNRSEEPVKYFERIRNVHDALITRLPLMKQLLIVCCFSSLSTYHCNFIIFNLLFQEPIQGEPIRTTIGVIEKPFGPVRLKVATVLRTLIVFNNPKMNLKINQFSLLYL